MFPDLWSVDATRMDCASLFLADALEFVDDSKATAALIGVTLDREQLASLNVFLVKDLYLI
jgi:hypothetical protein